MGTISALDVFTYEPERSEHNHEPDVNSECKSRFIRDLYVACRHEFRDLQIIYSDTSIIHQEATALISFDQVKTKMQSWQRHRKFPVVTSSLNFQRILQEENYKNISRHNLGRTEIQFVENDSLDHIAIMLADKELLSKVDTLQLFIQSTVEKLPQGVGAVQLTSISTLHAEHIFPVVWIIEQEQSESNCRKIVESLLSLKTIFSPVEIYGNFDSNYYKALQIVFPRASIRGTLYSHCKIMIDAAIRFQINLEDNSMMEILSKIVALSLLPVNQIQLALNWIIASMAANQRNHFNDLLEYYNHDWISGIGEGNYSVFNNRPCLWKNSDLLITSMVNRMSDNQSIWTLLENVLSGHSQCHFHLQNLQLKSRMNWNTNKIKNLFNAVKNCKLIDDCWKDIETDTPDFEGFLRKTTQIVIPVLRDLKFAGVRIPDHFKLIQLSVTENVGPFPQNNEVNVDDIDLLLGLEDHVMAAEEIAPANDNDEVQDVDNFELPPGRAESVMTPEETITANDIIEIQEDVDNIVFLPGHADSVMGEAEVIIVDENREIVVEDNRIEEEVFRVYEECIICRIKKVPTILYKPCLHVVVCRSCNEIW